MGNARYYKRIYGWLIDQILPLAVLIALMVVILCLAPSFSWFFAFALSSLAAYLTYILSTALFALAKEGASLGMVCLKLRSVHQDGSPLVGKEIWLRSIITGIWAFDLASAIYMLCSHTERSPVDRLCECTVISLSRR